MRGLPSGIAAFAWAGPQGKTWTPSVVTVRGGNVGGGNRLALGRSGNAQIAYAGSRYGSLKYAH